MKLYSRRQTLVFSLIAAVIFASAVFFAGIKYSTGNAGLSEIQSGTSSNPADFEESAENGFAQTEKFAQFKYAAAWKYGSFKHCK